MGVDFSDRRSEHCGSKNVVVGSVWEKRIKIDQVKGGVKVFFSGSDEELEEKTDADCLGTNSCKTLGRCQLSRKRKKWNQSDCFFRVSFSQPPVQAKSTTTDSARIIKTVAASDNRTVLCLEAKVVSKNISAKVVSKNISATDGIEEMKRNQVKKTIRIQELGNSVVPVTKKGVRSRAKKTETEDENIKIKMKNKFGSNEVYASEEKLKKLMSENTRRKTIEVHSLQSKYQKFLVKSSEFRAALIRPASRDTKPSTNVSLPCFSTLKSDSKELVLHEVRRNSPVDILTWRDFPISTFLLSVCTFIIIAESFARVLNISFVSTVSYLGLSYLAVMFTHQSLIQREHERIVLSNTDTVICEEEVIKILKMTLPYINKFISALKSLFSGDPAMTLKVSVPLFILARCGSCVSIWNITLTGFFALFTVPKLYLSYSALVSNKDEKWVRSLVIEKKSCCKYKITVATISFVLVWNLCSTITRIWALFMVFVATRCYLQSMKSKR